MKNRLILRLQWYYLTERNFAFIFSGLLLYLIIRYPASQQLSLWHGLLLMIVVLFQGQYYWLLKLRKLEGKRFKEVPLLRLFQRCQYLNWCLIALMPLVLGGQLETWAESAGRPTALWWALLANGFALLEHIKYYHFQLMIDTKSDLFYIIRHKRLKKASLSKDLAEGQF